MNLNFSLIATRAALPLLLALACMPAKAGSRYLANAAGDEISDNRTGLIWRRCAEGQSWNGSGCAGTARTFTWEGALAQAQSQASISGLAWRLPNVKELMSLTQPKSLNPAIDTTAFPGTPSSFFWSATPAAGSAFEAWVVYFNDGLVGTYFRDDGFGVAARLVRAGQ